MTTNQTDYLKSIGAADNCVQLNGSAYGTLDKSLFDFDSVSFSIEMYIETTDNEWIIFDTRGTGSLLTNRGIQLSVTNGNDYGNTAICDGNGNYIEFSNVAYNENDGLPHLLRLDFDNSTGTGRLFIDDVLKGTETDVNLINKNFNPTAGNEMKVGSSSNNTSHPFDGKLYGLKLQIDGSITEFPIAEGASTTSYAKDDQTKQITWNSGYEWKEQNEYFPNFIDGYTLGVNYIAHSENLDDSFWTKTNCTITANDTVAPDGTTTADLFLPTGNNGNVPVNINVPTQETVYTLSMYVKNKDWTGTTQRFLVTNSPSTVTYFSTGFSLTNEWVRIQATFTKPAGETILRVRASSITTRDGTGGFWVWGVQLQEEIASDYQKTYVSPTADAKLPYSINGIPLSFDTGVSLPQFFKNLGVSSINESSNTQYDFYKDISYIDGSRTHGQYEFYKKASTSRYEYFKNWKNETEFYANIDVDVIHDFYTFYKNAATILKDTDDFCNIDALRVGNTYNVADYPYLWYNTSAFSTYKDDTFRIANDNAILLDGIDGGGLLQTPVTFTEEFYIEEYLKIDDTSASSGHVYANSNGAARIFYANDKFGFNFNSGTTFYTTDIIDEGVISLFRFRFYIDGGVVKLEVSKDSIVVSTTTTTLTAIDITLDAFGLVRGAGTSVGTFEGTRFGLDLNGTKFNLAEGAQSASYERGNRDNQVIWQGGFSWVSQDRFVPNRTEGYTAGVNHLPFSDTQVFRNESVNNWTKLGSQVITTNNLDAFGTNTAFSSTLNVASSVFDFYRRVKD